MRCYVTGSKSRFSISDFVQAQPEDRRKSTANVISCFLALLLSLEVLRHVSCYLEKRGVALSTLGSPATWPWLGGSHPGPRGLWLLTSARQPMRMLCAGSRDMLHDTSHAQLMLWDNRERGCTYSNTPLPISLLHLHRVLLSGGVEIRLCKP